ncbi:MAG: DUF502 domain-containing protein [Magnetococcales bacterium]|nr:DUF502 domain-containing protein [Magnetococcales bacterium]
MRRHFMTGLLVTLPLGLTLFILTALVRFSDKALRILPSAYHPDSYLSFHLPGLGLLFTLILIYIIGLLFEHLLGRRLLAFWENVLNRIPLVRSVHTAIKQLLETLFSQGDQSFRQVVLIEYPRPGLQAVGFVTGKGCSEIVKKANRGALVTVFIPTTPNPTSGFLVMVSESDLIPLEMSVEDGLKLVISGGIVTPPEPKGSSVQEIGQQQTGGTTPA